MNTYSAIAIFLPIILIFVSFFDTTAWKGKRKYFTIYPTYIFLYLLIEFTEHSPLTEHVYQSNIGDQVSESKHENEYFKKSNIKIQFFDFLYIIISGLGLSAFFASGWIVFAIECFLK